MHDLFGHNLDAIPSPLCIREEQSRCPKKGLAIVGPVELVEHGDCEHQSITCETCGATGHYSTNLKFKDTPHADRHDDNM